MASPFAEPDSENVDGADRQGRDAVFASLAVAGDVRTGYTVLYTGNIGKGVDVNFRRFDYDTRLLLARYRERGLADPFAPLLSATA